MMIRFSAALIFLICLFRTSLFTEASESPEQQVVFESPQWPFKRAFETLLASINKAQAKRSTNYFPEFTYPPLHWQKQAGIFDSFVHLNFHGDLPLSATVRNGYKFPDDNAFVTIFISHALLDVVDLLKLTPFPIDGFVGVGEQVLIESIKAIGSHRDANMPAGVPIYSFWNQVALNVSSSNGDHDNSHYYANPPNIQIPLSKLSQGVNILQLGLRALNLSIPQIKRVEKVLKGVGGFVDSFQSVWRIPSDADDSGCNLALGLALLSSRSFPKAASTWRELNNVEDDAFLFYFLKNSYRPFMRAVSRAEFGDNEIDPRTYYWLRGFLKNEIELGTMPLEDISLITTWMQTTSDLPAEITYRKMPFNVNNIDLSVTANALFGIVSFYLRENAPEIDEDMAKLIKSNVRLLSWALKEEIVEKYTTIALLYYPPKFAFYWFVSRIVQLLSSFRLDTITNTANRVLLKETSDALLFAMKTFAVPKIFQSMQCTDGFGGVCYWDDFLGNAERLRGKPVKLHEDRVFSTAMALNALLDLYTIRSEGALKLRDGTPIEVFSVIERANTWLLTRSWFYPKENGFFSGSVKNNKVQVFYMPHNSVRFINGTRVSSCSDLSGDRSSSPSFATLSRVTFSVKGYISEDDYGKMQREQICLGKTVPEETEVMQGLNCEGCVFPYWSSPALTDALSLLALSKFFVMGN